MAPGSPPKKTMTWNLGRHFREPKPVRSILPAIFDHRIFLLFHERRGGMLT
jgi:hypothetical protein